jgi:hypothetical protein
MQFTPSYSISVISILILYFHPNIILPSTPSPKLFFPSGIPRKMRHASLKFSHACCMPYPSHYPWFNHPNNIFWRVQIMKLLIENLKSWSFSLCNCFLPCHFIPHGILFSTLFSSYVHTLGWEPRLTPVQTTGQNTVLYILIFIFLDGRWEDRILWTEWLEGCQNVFVISPIWVKENRGKFRTTTECTVIRDGHFTQTQGTASWSLKGTVSLPTHKCKHFVS